MTVPRSLADALRDELRTIANPDRDWVVPVNRALAEAYRGGSSDDVAEIALLGALWLDARGRFREAMANIEFGLATLDHGAAQRSHLLGAQAGLLALAGRLEEARRATDRARDAVPAAPRARLELAAYDSVVECVALAPTAANLGGQAIVGGDRAGYDWLASGVGIWLVPWHAARGDTATAAVLVRSLGARAQANGHATREADAKALEAALDAASGEDQSSFPGDDVRALARWRRLLAVGRSSLIRGSWLDARVALELHEELVERMNPGFRFLSGGFLALLDVYEGVRSPSIPSPEGVPVTLITLPAMLAAAEAAALGGSAEACLAWLEGLRGIPEGVTTSLEWPVAVDRIRALLLVRLGRVAPARASFARAVRSMEAAGNPIEVELTRLHRAEAEAIAAHRPDRSLVRERGEAMRRLAALGVSPFPPAYAVTRALSDDRVSAASELLTAREIEVVRALADGLSYRGAGERLGISWRTVQSHATRAYRKLGASRRSEAVAVARARRLIER
ncbi:MAG: LuxR C-terminal-related transcriptional regulator [Dehalococcoidia bacterium]